MDWNPYLTGGFGIAGTLLGVIFTYHLARQLADANAAHAARQAETNALRNARAKLRAAFAPALGQIYLAQKHGDHDRPSIEDFVKNNLLVHASAIEEFRPFVTGGDAAYQETWESYRQFANEPMLAYVEDQIEKLQSGSSLKQRIEAILVFANP